MIMEAFVINRKAWCRFKKQQLTKNTRVECLINASTDPERKLDLQAHAKWLLDMGCGEIPTIFNDMIEIPA